MYKIYLNNNINNNNNNLDINKALVIRHLNPKLSSKNNSNQQFSNQFSFGINQSNYVNVKDDSCLLNKFKQFLSIKKETFINNELHPLFATGKRFILNIQPKCINSITFLNTILITINSHTFEVKKLPQEKMNEILFKTYSVNFIHLKYLTEMVEHILNVFRKLCWLNKDYSVERKNNKYNTLFDINQQIIDDRLMDIYGKHFQIKHNILFLNNISDNINYFFRKNSEFNVSSKYHIIFLNANNKIINSKNNININKNDKNGTKFKSFNINNPNNNNVFELHQIKIEYIDEKDGEKIYYQLFVDNEKYRNILRNYIEILPFKF